MSSNPDPGLDGSGNTPLVPGLQTSSAQQNGHPDPNQQPEGGSGADPTTNITNVGATTTTAANVGPTTTNTNVTASTASLDNFLNMLTAALASQQQRQSLTPGAASSTDPQMNLVGGPTDIGSVVADAVSRALTTNNNNSHRGDRLQYPSYDGAEPKTGQIDNEIAGKSWSEWNYQVSVLLRIGGLSGLVANARATSPISDLSAHTQDLRVLRHAENLHGQLVTRLTGEAGRIARGSSDLVSLVHLLENGFRSNTRGGAVSGSS